MTQFPLRPLCVVVLLCLLVAGLKFSTSKGYPPIRTQPPASTLSAASSPSGSQPSNTVLVTGALGCIGPAVVDRLLAAHYNVIVLDLAAEVEALGAAAPKVRVVQADLRDRAALRQVVPGVRGVVNLAAMSRVSWCALWPQPCLDMNVQGTQALLAVLSEQPEPRPWLLQASSREVYGGVTEMPVSEATPHKALNVYGQSKVETELVVRAAVKGWGLSAIVLRFSNVYGASKDHVDRVIPAFVAAALAHQPLALSPSKVVDFTHVDDAAKSVLLAVARLDRGTPIPFEDYNIASGRSVQLIEVAREILRLTQSRSHLALMRSDPMFVDRYSSRLDKAAAQLGFIPEVPVEQGLARYVALVRANRTLPGATLAGFQTALGQSSMRRLYGLQAGSPPARKAPRVVILGAGVCGLCAARRLVELGHTDFTVVEAAPEAGGLAASATDDKGFTWDLGVHVLFSHSQAFDALLDSAVPPQEWAHHRRTVKAYLKGTYVDYPVHSHLFMLPEKEMLQDVDGLLDAALNTTAEPPANFRDWAVRQFGPGLARTFLLPYNRKVWAYPPERLGTGWVGGRVEPLDVREALASAVLRRPAHRASDSPFRYPLNGSGQIWTNVQRALPPSKMLFGATVERVSADQRVHLRGGQSIPYDALLSTMPLDGLLGALDRTLRPPRPAASALRHQTVHLIGLGFRGPLPAHLRGVHWLYFPEPEVPFYRLTMMSSLSPRLVPGPGHFSFLAEVSESDQSLVDESAVVAATLAACKALNLIAPTARLVSTWHRRLEYGYPVPYLERDADVQEAEAHLRPLGIWSRGRFGAWRYEAANQDHVCMQGVEAVENMLLGLPEITMSQPHEVNAMYRPNPPHPWGPPAPPPFPAIEFVLSRCTESLDWLPGLLRRALPASMHFVVQVYERCGAPPTELTLWDSVYHVRRTPFPSTSPLEGVLHHFAHASLLDTSMGIVVLHAQQPNVEAVAGELAAVLALPTLGFHFLAGREVTLKMGKEQCTVYQRLMAGDCPKTARTREGAQFAVGRGRLGLAAPFVWRDAQRMARRAHGPPPALPLLWPLLFGEAPDATL